MIDEALDSPAGRPGPGGRRLWFPVQSAWRRDHHLLRPAAGQIHGRAGSRHGQIKATLGARGYKLDWDIVENTFVHTETGQTLKELVEQAISKHLKKDVEL
jgi:hypothetical protein